MSEEMSPIKLLRILTNYKENVVSDYEVVALIFEELVRLREENKALKPIFIQTTTEFPDPHVGMEMK